MSLNTAELTSGSSASLPPSTATLGHITTESSIARLALDGPALLAGHAEFVICDHTVSLLNPARIKGFAQATMQRNKTDKLDSAVMTRSVGAKRHAIAAFCAKHQPTPWEPHREEQRRLRALIRHRDELLQTQLQQQNQPRDTSDALVKRSLETVVKTIVQPAPVIQVCSNCK
jgi:hypothetical protein